MGSSIEITTSCLITGHNWASLDLIQVVVLWLGQHWHKAFASQPSWPPKIPWRRSRPQIVWDMCEKNEIYIYICIDLINDSVYNIHSTNGYVADYEMILMNHSHSTHGSVLHCICIYVHIRIHIMLCICHTMTSATAGFAVIVPVAQCSDSSKLFSPGATSPPNPSCEDMSTPKTCCR